MVVDMGDEPRRFVERLVILFVDAGEGAGRQSKFVGHRPMMPVAGAICQTRQADA
jgi:hypothetical protein